MPDAAEAAAFASPAAPFPNAPVILEAALTGLAIVATGFTILEPRADAFVSLLAAPNPGETSRAKPNGSSTAVRLMFSSPPNLSPSADIIPPTPASPMALALSTGEVTMFQKSEPTLAAEGKILDPIADKFCDEKKSCSGS